MKAHLHQLLFYFTAVLFSSLFFVDGVLGQNTYDVTGLTTWSSFSPAPSNADIVNVSNGAVLTVDVADAICKTLSIGNSLAGTTSTVLIQDEKRLSVSDDVAINSGTSDQKSLLIVSGTLTVNGNVSVDSNPNSTFELSGGTAAPFGLFSVSGSFTKGKNGIFKVGTGSTVNFTGSEAQTIPALNYHHLIISGERTTNDITLAAGEIKVAGDYVATATFTTGGYLTSGNKVTLSGTLTLQKISGTPSFNNFTINSTGDKDFDFSTVTISGTFLNSSGTMNGGSSTFIFTGGSGIIDGKSAKNFCHLQINTGTTLTTTEKAGTVNISGDFTNDGNYSPNVGSKTNFERGDYQSISGSGATAFGLFEISSSSTVNSGTHNFKVNGNSFDVAGGSTFNGENNRVTFAGSVNVTGGGTINFNDLILNGSIQSSLNTKSFSVGSLPGIEGDNEQGIGIESYSDSQVSTIFSGTEVTINGELIIESGSSLTLESTVVSTGSLKINGSASGSGIVNIHCYIPDELNGDDWHIISSPVNEIGMATFAAENKVNATATDYDLAPYDEDAQSWNPYLPLIGSASFEAGRGYAIRRELNPSINYIVFSGAADNLTVGNNTGLISIYKNKNGWNAVGNPYTTAIGISSFLDANEDKLAISPYNVAYLWDPEYSQYVGEPDGFAAIGQGFMVKSKIGGATIDFTKEMQSHRDVSVKSSEIPWPAIHLMVSAEGWSDKTTLIFSDSMSTGLDNWYDIGKFKGNPEIALYTQMPDNDSFDLQDQALPDLCMEACRIPVGLDLKSGGTVKFTIKTESFPEERFVYFEDVELNSMTLLSEDKSEYSTFLPADNKGTGRFYLVMTKNAHTQTSKIAIPLFSSYVQNKIISVDGPSHFSTQVELYGIDGKCWYKNKAINLNKIRIDGSSFPDGVYLVRIKYNGGVQVIKIVLCEN